MKVAVNRLVTVGSFLIECAAHPPAYGDEPATRRISSTTLLSGAKRDFLSQGDVDAYVTARSAHEVGEWKVLDLTAAGVS